jgi:pimeloyl-ACP methyl ester carboxylesterase
MDYVSWGKRHLKRVSVRHGTETTTAWCTEASDKPLAILIHGIGGDHFGLAPLAQELSSIYRIAIIELPGHGKSDRIALPNAVAFQTWFETALNLFEQVLGKPALICAHSFGCSAVLGEKIIRNRKVILINPVPAPSDMYARYAKVIMRSASFWAYIYNWHPFVYLRGRALLKIYARDVRRRVRLIGWQSRPTYKQTVFQAGLVDMILDGSAYQHVNEGKVTLVVCGMFDTTAKQRDSLEIGAVFGNSKVVFLRGGHLLPLESPKRVASVITEAMIH